MTDEDLSTAAVVPDSEEAVNLATELVDEDAQREIDEAVHGHRGAARKYVLWARRHNPDATPVELIAILERHYVTSISVAGAAVTVGSIAAEVGIAMIPGVGAAAVGTKAVSKEVGKKATKHVAKAMAKSVTLGIAKNSAGKAAALLPAGDEQLQFETTTLFVLALADIHGLEYDRDQAQALVYGLSNGRVSQQQIATMATALTASSTEIAVADEGTKGGERNVAGWASTLADSLPGGAAQNLVRGIQTGVLDNVEVDLGKKQQAAVDYGVGALVGGITRFVFGREVVDASHSAFPEPPREFPDYLDISSKSEIEEGEPNRAFAALEGAAKSIGAGTSTGATALGTGVSTVAGAVTRPFRSIDVDGDGVPDEPQVLAAARGVEGAVTGAAGGVGGAIASRFRFKRHGSHATGSSKKNPEDEEKMEGHDAE